MCEFGSQVSQAFTPQRRFPQLGPWHHVGATMEITLDKNGSLYDPAGTESWNMQIWSWIVSTSTIFIKICQIRRRHSQRNNPNNRKYTRRKNPNNRKYTWQNNPNVGVLGLAPCHNSQKVQVHGGDQSPLPPLWNSFVGTGIHNGPVPPALGLKRERTEGRKREKFYIYSDVTHTHTHTHSHSASCHLVCGILNISEHWSFCMVLSFSYYTVWCQTWDPAWPTRQGKILDSHLCTGVAWDQQMQPLRHKRVYDVLHSTAPRWPDLSKIVLTWCWLRCFISYTQHILSETLKCAHPASCGGSHGLDTRSTSLCQRQSSTSFGNLHINVLLRWWKTWQPTDPQAQNKSHHSSSQRQRFCVDLFLSFPF